jgi:hypothetical protein
MGHVHPALNHCADVKTDFLFGHNLVSYLIYFWPDVGTELTIPHFVGPVLVDQMPHQDASIT